MNNKYLFFHSERNIKYFDLYKPFRPQLIKKVALKIDELEEDAFIDQIRMSSDSDIVAIIIQE